MPRPLSFLEIDSVTALAQVLGLFRWRVRQTHPYYVVRSTKEGVPGGVWWLSFAEPPGPLRPELAPLHLALEFNKAARFADQGTAHEAIELGRRIWPNWRTNGNCFDVVPMQGEQWAKNPS